MLVMVEYCLYVIHRCMASVYVKKKTGGGGLLTEINVVGIFLIYVIISLFYAFVIFQ